MNTTLSSEPRTTWLSAPIALSGLLAGGEHRTFAVRGTSHAVRLSATIHGITVWVTGNHGVDTDFECFLGDPCDQAPAWAHATELLAQVFATAPAEVIEQVEPAPARRIMVVDGYNRWAGRNQGVPVTALAPPTRAERRIHAPRPVMGCDLTDTQIEALAEARDQHDGIVHRGGYFNVRTLNVLIRRGYAVGIDGEWWSKGYRRNIPAIVAAKLTPRGLAELLAETDRRADRAALAAIVAGPTAELVTA